MKTLLLCVILLLLSGSTLVRAQDDAPQPWPIVERCLPEPVALPAGWTFAGQLLMTGWGGIHAVSAAYDTPYVVHWGRGILSPDGEWVLSQEEEQSTFQGNFGPAITYVFGDITVTNIASNESRRFLWNYNYTWDNPTAPYDPIRPRWLDNTRFLAPYLSEGQPARVGNIETGEVTDWAGPRYFDYAYSISPDLTRMVSTDYLYNLADNSLIREKQIVTNIDLISAVWTPDSTMFADVAPRNARERSQQTMLIYDRNGVLIATPFMTEGNLSFGQWSPDGRYFGFTEFSGYYSPWIVDNSYLLDMRNEVVFDLCIDYARGWAWSEDGTAFATIIGEGQQPVVIVNLEEWQTYIVAYHTGRMLFWHPGN